MKLKAGVELKGEPHASTPAKSTHHLTVTITCYQWEPLPHSTWSCTHNSFRAIKLECCLESTASKRLSLIESLAKNRKVSSKAGSIKVAPYAHTPAAHGYMEGVVFGHSSSSRNLDLLSFEFWKMYYGKRKPSSLLCTPSFLPSSLPSCALGCVKLGMCVDGQDMTMESAAS